MVLRGNDVKLIRLGDRFLNLDLITSVSLWCERPGEPVLTVYFAGDRENVRIGKAEEVALLWNWLDVMAITTPPAAGAHPPGQEG